jgi:DNA-directed RNA polymerase subunit RPC12/RpoP
MIDWKTADEKALDQKCVRCGGTLSTVELTTADSGLKYDGLVCHSCKSVIWLKRGKR